MSIGQNLQFLRRMHGGMTQEEFAESLGVSRQTVSKWELDLTCPEMDKLIGICEMFSCSMDELVREDMNISGDEYSDIRIETVESFAYTKYAVISCEPEEDAISHVQRLAERLGISSPVIIGWDFPLLSQEQINVLNMHGYEAALIIPGGTECPEDIEVIRQDAQKYIAVTITDPMNAPFRTIPNAYKLLMAHMNVNGINHREKKGMISCFEREYSRDGVDHMDVYIAVE